jgi:hypothetical protein
MKKNESVLSKNLSIGAITPSLMSDRNVPLDGGNVDCKTSMATGVPILMPLMFCDLSALLMLLIAGTRSCHICCTLFPTSKK